jgi:hypothetical protein
MDVKIVHEKVLPVHLYDLALLILWEGLVARELDVHSTPVSTRTGEKGGSAHGVAAVVGVSAIRVRGEACHATDNLGLKAYERAVIPRANLFCDVTCAAGFVEPNVVHVALDRLVAATGC